MGTGEDPFGPEVVAAVVRHMNADHADDSLLIVRALGDRPAATDASMTGMSRAGIRFEAATPDGVVEVEVPWRGAVVARADVRADVVRMYQDACTALGIEPRAVAGDPLLPKTSGGRLTDRGQVTPSGGFRPD